MFSLNPSPLESKSEVVLGSTIFVSTFVNSASLAIFSTRLFFYEKPHTNWTGGYILYRRDK